jgi:hypothetical protein
MGLSVLSGCANHGSWSRYEVGEVEFYSQVSERKTQELLTKFSKFRQVTAALTSASTVEPTMPTRVYLFADQSSYEDHVNIENSAGVFTRARGEFNMAMTVGQEGEYVLFHEYSHMILANVPDMSYPIWFNEGFADFMATMHFRGDDVAIGEIRPGHVFAVANDSRWVPLSELFHGSAFRARGDPDLTNRYYAQSWLVVHYLLRGPRSESGELERYLDLVHAGGDPVGAVPQAFGVTTEQLEKELRVYVKMRQMAYRTMPIEQFGVSVERFEGVPLSEAQSELARAHLCLRMGKLELADELLSSVAVSEASKRADIQLTLAALQTELADDSSWERSPSWVADTIPALTEFPDPEPMSALARRCGHGQLSAPYRKCVVDGSARDCIKLAAQHEGRTEEVHRSCMEGFERHACDLGSPLGCARLGNNYVKPWGPLSNRRAFDAFERACALGFRFTCLAVADMISLGAARGTRERAKAIYQQACDEGEARGCYGLEGRVGFGLYASSLAQVPRPDPRMLRHVYSDRPDEPLKNVTGFCIEEGGSPLDVVTLESSGSMAVDKVCRDTVERWELEYALEPGSSKRPLCTFVVFELDLSA